MFQQFLDVVSPAMKMLLEKLRDAGLGQTQKEAIVDLCLLGMYVDKQLSLAEQDFVDDDASRSDWESGISFSSYLQKITPQVRAANNPQKVTAFLENVCERLNSREAKDTAIGELEAIFSTDAVVPSETEFLAQVKQLLG
jgi:hypothetical protein